MAIKLSVPRKAAMKDDSGTLYFQYFKVRFLLEEDGTIDLPKWLVPEALSRGCTRVDGEDETIEERAALEEAPGHELSIFLNARGARDHRFENKTHAMSAALNRSACPRCREAAGALDELYRAVQGPKGTGHLVVMTDDEKREAALGLFDGILRVSRSGEVVPL